ncbi:hypothetical protein O181_112062 [Austropuccinia psidii MF-1]|uniref:Uncharacterized protein n=1 Tax=Austropuccinia psidii MF-1 TaxID=1389203 RepID=A0A9Q3PU03_9BASI|nr:hypothetical protein [Austropuccinia psidii MF-1]
MSNVHLRSLGVPRNQTEDRLGVFINRRSGSGHHGGWQNTQGDNAHTAIHLPIHPGPQIRGLEEYGSISSAPPTPQRLITMENGQKAFKSIFTLGRVWQSLPQDMSQRDTFQRP